MIPAYDQAARELAPYQGRPKHEPVVVGPYAADSGLQALSPDAGTPDDVRHVYAPLSESVGERGGYLIPATYRGAR